MKVGEQTNDAPSGKTDEKSTLLRTYKDIMMKPFQWFEEYITTGNIYTELM